MESFDHLSRLSRRERALFGLRAGVRIGAFLAVATGLYPFVSRAEQPMSITIPLLVGVFLGSVAAGVVFGILRPRVRDTYGAALLGAACLAPLLAAVVLTLRGLSALDWSAGLTLIGIALFAGGLLGALAWRGWTQMQAASGGCLTSLQSIRTSGGGHVGSLSCGLSHRIDAVSDGGVCVV